MKKLLLFLVLTASLFLSCERDDICLEETTSNLIIRFYDNADPTMTKSVSNLYVWAQGKDSLYSNISTDSIAIPLNGNVMQTIYNFSKATTQDQTTFDYTPSSAFVSRSCGYKAIFENLTQTTSNSWIQNIMIENTTIDNQTSAHVKIFH